MDAQSYTAQERRAANQVWAAAGAYGFEPLFLARYTDGTTDFYMNTVVGLIHKYYGDALIRSIFDAWDGDLRQTMLDDMTWLYLEMQPIGWSCPAARCWKRCAMPMQITFCDSIQALPSGVDGKKSAGVHHAGCTLAACAGPCRPGDDPL